MATLSPLFTAALHQTSATIGSGSLAAGHTLILCTSAYTDDGAGGQPQFSSVNIAGDGATPNTSIAIGTGPEGVLRFWHYVNTNQSSIDLTNAIELVYSQLGVEYAIAVRAFTVDTALEILGVSTGSNVVNGDIRFITEPSNEAHISIAAVSDYCDPVDWSYVDSGSNYTTSYPVIGTSDNTGVPASTAQVSLGVFDYQGVVGDGNGDTTLDLEGSVDLWPTDNFSYGMGMLTVYQELDLVVTDIAPKVLEMAIMPRTAGALSEVSAEWVQSYELGLLFSEAVQPYSSVITKSIIQSLDSLQSISQKSLLSTYNLGVTDVGVAVDQGYGLAVSASWRQDYTQLESISLGIQQSYDSVFPVMADFESSYDLSNTNTVYNSWSSHYSSYSPSNIIVITSPPGLTYKPGYTIEPDS